MSGGHARGLQLSMAAQSAPDHSPRSSSLSRRSSSSHPLCPFELLSIREHNGHRGSGSSSMADLTCNTSPPPTPGHDSLALYPLAPHLTPQHSPTRPLSPALSASPGKSYHRECEASQAIATTHLMGRLTVKVVEASGLEAPTGDEKPYVLLQYDRTDSVSREYDALPSEHKAMRRKHGIKSALKATKPQLRQTQSTQSVMTVRRVAGAGTRRREDAASKLSFAANGDELPHKPDPSQIGTADAPKWNHVAQFDVVQPGRTLLFCVYDKAAPQAGNPKTYHGFLGCAVIDPPLALDPGLDGEGVDVWLPLESALNPDSQAELHVRILFEPLQARPKLSVDDFEVLKRIGEGSFGKVFRVRKKDTKRVYAMKVISKSSIVSKEALSQVLAERQVLAKTLDSPFLVGLKFSFQSETDLFFVMDYKSGGELFDLLQREGGRFGEDKVRFYLAEIVLALGYLHDNGIIYRDLKPENCLLDGSGHVVLVDFGLSKMLKSAQEFTRTLCGTTAFMAPEVLLDVPYNYLADLWSLGVLAYEMLFGWSPFYSESRIEEYERILQLPIKIPSRQGYSEASRDFIFRLLTREPAERLGAKGGSAEVQAHAFFAAIDWERCARRALSPPYKPPVYADDDICDERARSARWMFGDGSACASRSSSFSRDSPAGSTWANAQKTELGTDALFRDFTFHWKEHESRRTDDRRSSWNGEAP